jgi:hypothetical protein
MEMRKFLQGSEAVNRIAVEVMGAMSADFRRIRSPGLLLAPRCLPVCQCVLSSPAPARSTFADALWSSWLYRKNIRSTLVSKLPGRGACATHFPRGEGNAAAGGDQDGGGIESEVNRISRH